MSRVMFMLVICCYVSLKAVDTIGDYSTNISIKSYLVTSSGEGAVDSIKHCEKRFSLK